MSNILRSYGNQITALRIDNLVAFQPTTRIQGECAYLSDNLGLVVQRILSGRAL